MGSILRQIKDLEEEYLENIKEISDESNLRVIPEEDNYASSLITEELKNIIMITVDFQKTEQNINKGK